MKADASNETSYVEADAGNFVGFEIARFFSGLGETVNSRARTDYWRGSARAEIEIVPNVTLAGGWAENSRTLNGQALIASLYLNTVTYAGVPTGQPPQESTPGPRSRAERRLRRQRDGPHARPLRRQRGLVPDAAERRRDPDAAEIVVPGGQGGPFERTVNTYGGGASFSMWGVTLTGDYRHDDAEPADLPDGLHQPGPLQVPGRLELQRLPQGRRLLPETDADDDIVEIGYKTKVREFAATSSSRSSRTC